MPSTVRRATLLSALLLALFAPGALAAAPVIDPAGVDFGPVDAHGGSVVAQTFTITNQSLGPVAYQAALSGPQARAFTIIQNSCQGPIDALVVCEVRVRYDPTVANAADAAQLDITGDNDPATVPLNGQGAAGTISSGTPTFNAQPWYYGSQQGYLQLHNAFFSTQLGAISFSGPDADRFSIDNGNCDGHLLSAWSDCNLTVRFDPRTDRGTFTATLDIPADQASGALSIPLSATALGGPVATIDNDQRDFGQAAIGDSAPSQPVTITNTGDAPLQVQQLIVVSGTPKAFPLSHDACSARIELPGEHCTFEIAFTPRRTGLYEASVFVVANTPNSITQMALTATGLDPDAADTTSLTDLTDSAAGFDVTQAADGPLTDTLPGAGPRVCRSVGPPALHLSGVAVLSTGAQPASGLAPLTFTVPGATTLTADLDGVRRAGRGSVSFSPRALAVLDDGPHTIVLSDGSHNVSGIVMLDACPLALQATATRGGAARITISGSRAMSRAVLTLPAGARVRRGARIIVTGPAGTESFALRTRFTSYNEMHVSARGRKVTIRGLQDAAVVTLRLPSATLRAVQAAGSGPSAQTAPSPRLLRVVATMPGGPDAVAQTPLERAR